MAGLSTGNVHFRVRDGRPLEVGKGLDPAVHVVEGGAFLLSEVFIGLLAVFRRNDEIADRAILRDVPQPLRDLQ